MATEHRLTWVVTVSPDRPIDAVATDVKAAGFEVRDILPFTGTIVGYSDESVAEKLRNIRSVVDVSPDYPVHAFPSGSPVP
jgi:hypothetical protein